MQYFAFRVWKSQRITCHRFKKNKKIDEDDSNEWGAQFVKNFQKIFKPLTIFDTMHNTVNVTKDIEP